MSRQDTLLACHWILSQHEQAHSKAAGRKSVQQQRKTSKLGMNAEESLHRQLATKQGLLKSCQPADKHELKAISRLSAS